jgi:hypothetical protein
MSDRVPSLLSDLLSRPGLIDIEEVPEELFPLHANLEALGVIANEVVLTTRLHGNLSQEYLQVCELCHRDTEVAPVEDDKGETSSSPRGYPL